MTTNQTPDYMVIGHMTKDLTAQGPILGGPCSYSAITAQKLKQQVALVTRVGPDIPSLASLNGIQARYLPDQISTTFKNIYSGSDRRQQLLSIGQPLTDQDIPPAWQTARIVHLAPVAQELPPRLCAQFPESLTCATIQGWMRGRDEENNVVFSPNPELDQWLNHLDILVMSEADVFGHRERLVRYLTSVRIGVETLGADGCRLYYQDEITHVPSLSVREIDPTGAGDIFSAAFFVGYDYTDDAFQAARFANACAALSVQQEGVEAIPTLEAVLAQME